MVTIIFVLMIVSLLLVFALDIRQKACPPTLEIKHRPILHRK